MRRSRPILIVLFLALFCADFASAVEVDVEVAKDASKYFSRAEILKSYINPHEQISDEGEILWKKCYICHTAMPDIDKARSIKDVKIRFEDDPKEMCYRCHPEPMHPGGAWIGSAFGTVGSPNHLVVPPPNITRNQALSLKEAMIMLPLDPKSGKQFCATCHNPHERGLLIGRADAGSDSVQRKRTERMTGATLCQYCHRK